MDGGVLCASWIFISFIELVPKILLGKCERKRLLQGPRHRREDNIEIDLKEIYYEYEHWIGLSDPLLWRR